MVAARPDFFIVGAPKSGTTALYQYLARHPNIYLPEVKEPHYFATDLGSYPVVKTLEAYLTLFAQRTHRHLRAGEGSVYYLSSRAAIPRIRDFEPGARLIAMLRNPVDLTHSLHSHLLLKGNEWISDFETAWRLQARRRQGLTLPPWGRKPSTIHYEEIGRLGTQTERLLSEFPREQVKLILFDDFEACPRQVYEDVLAFLGVPGDDRADFPRVNENRRFQVSWLGKLLQKPPPGLRRAYRKLKRVTGGGGLDVLRRELLRRNTVRERRKPLSAPFRAELVETFRGEMTLLSRLLGRDLSHWQ